MADALLGARKRMMSARNVMLNDAKWRKREQLIPNLIPVPLKSVLPNLIPPNFDLSQSPPDPSQPSPSQASEVTIQTSGVAFES